jgi:hypothetical protein
MAKAAQQQQIEQRAHDGIDKNLKAMDACVMTALNLLDAGQDPRAEMNHMMRLIHRQAIEHNALVDAGVRSC